MYKGIYKITNKINGKMYIGSSKNVFKRWEEHISQLDSKIHHSWKFQNDWNKYKYTDFAFEILEILTYKDDLLQCEQKWLDKYESFDDLIGYNIMNYTKGEYLSIERGDTSNIYDFYKTIDNNTKVLLKCNLKILDDRINNIGEIENSLSKIWFTKATNETYKQLNNNIGNYFKNKIGSLSKTSYWTTFISYQKKLSGNGYAKSFIPVNASTENKRNNLSFMINSYVNPFLERELKKKNIIINKEGYSLSILLNWILCVSDINKQINIYIPSSRMRNLLIKWLNNDNEISFKITS